MRFPRLILSAMFLIAFFVLGCTDDDNGVTSPVIPPPTITGHWDWVNPLPTGNELFNVFFLNDATGWIVGRAGTILRTTDGGESWEHQVSPTLEDLEDVYFTDELHGWAVGGYAGYGSGSNRYGTRSALLRTTDGGMTWEIQGSNPSSGKLEAIQFISNEEGWIVGLFGNILHTTDGGASWTIEYSDNEAWLVGVSFTDADTGFAAGYTYGDVYPPYNALVLKTTDHGTTWCAVFDSTNLLFNSFTMVDNQRGWAAGRDYEAYNSEIWHTTDGGESWFSQFSSRSWSFTAIAFLDLWRGVAIDPYRGILATSDGGESWNARAAAEGGMPYGAAYSSNGTCWTVGYLGTIQKSTDAGFTWTSCSRILTLQDIWDITFVNSQTGFLSGQGGLLARTEDGGNSWEKIEGVTGNALFGLNFLDENNGWAVGGSGDHAAILHTMDGGFSWTETDFYGVHGLWDIAFQDAQTCWAVGSYGIILHSSDGGQSWVHQNCGDQYEMMGVTYLGPGHVIAVGGFWYSDRACAIIQTTDGGAHWTANELPGVWHGRDLCFINSREGWVVGLYGLIMHTTDGGNTWEMQQSGTSYDLYAVAFRDRFTGWAVGSYGTMLRTSDGGASWQLEPNLSDLTVLDVSFRDGIPMAVGCGGMILRYEPDASATRFH